MGYGIWDKREQARWIRDKSGRAAGKRSEGRKKEGVK
jgi:hypothetical protein